MGINSTEVAYHFGQMGSAITDSTTQTLLPPIGLKIIAITALNNSTFTTLRADSKYDVELESTQEQNIFITTGNGSHRHGVLSRGNGSAFSGHNDNGSNDTGKITLNTADSRIKKGMIIESEVMFPRNLDDPYVVLSHDGATTAQGLIVAKKSNPNSATDPVANLANGSAESLYFSESDIGVQSMGAGGLVLDSSDEVPKGVTIYGRWESMKLASGRVIVYFGA